MKKTALRKDIWREILNNKARFIALFAIITLGVAFYAGIKATGPDMLYTANRYYRENNLFDLKVLSSYGIEAKDIAALEEVEGLSVEPIRTLDLEMERTDFLVRIYPYDAGQPDAAGYEVVEGRLPEKSGEIALDSIRSFRETYQIGDTITFRTGENETESESGAEDPEETAGLDPIELKDQTYTIVGFVTSPLYIEKISRGSATDGNGSLDGFSVVPAVDISGDIYTEAYLQLEGSEDLTAYSEEYETLMEEKTEEVEVALNGRPVARINEIRQDARSEIQDGEEELQQAKNQLADAEAKLADGRASLDEGIAKYKANKALFDEKTAEGEAKLAASQEELAQGRAQYEAGLAEWEASARKYADAKAAWELQKEALKDQLDAAVTLETFLASPPATAQAQELVNQINNLLASIDQLETSSTMMADQQKTNQAQLEELEQKQADLNTQIAANQAAAAAAQAKREEVTSRLESLQDQLDLITAAAAVPAEQLTDGQKASYRQEVSSQGSLTTAYPLFLQYLDGQSDREEVTQALAADQAAFQELQQQQQQAEQELAGKQSEAAALQSEQKKLLEQGTELQYAIDGLSTQRSTVEDSLANLHQRLNQIEQQIQQQIPDVQAQIIQADRQFEEQGSQLSAARTELAAAYHQLQLGEKELAAGKAELDSQRQEGQKQLDAAWADIQAGEAEYQKNLALFQTEKAEAETEISEGEQQLEAARTSLAALEEPVYYVQGRSENPGYEEYGDNADRMSAIAEIFPVFFFLIAALVSFTTMTRMVDEQRQQMGTLKGLGYSSRDIARKFLVYAAIACGAGTLVGLVAGNLLFPSLIFDAYGSLYNIPSLQIRYYASYSLISFLVALLCTIGPAALAVGRSLREQPATLMRPKAPKHGKRLFLERVPAIWNRFNFNAKITVRNLLRYKIRNSMTIIGVAGCTALILTGFALKNSISGLAETQFHDVMRYNAVVSLRTEASQEEQESYRRLIGETPEITASLPVMQEGFKSEKAGLNTQDVTLFVPETTEKLDQFVRLRDRLTGERYQLNEEGAVISEKLAELMEIEAGDEIVIRDSEQAEYTIPVAAITENYTGHYLYLTPALYEDIFSEEAAFNTELLQYDEPEAFEDELETLLGQEPAVLLISFIGAVDRAFSDTLNSLDVVIVVLIVSAAALAFVVLYNLTNINVSERIRELSTIKVLGFYNKEVSMYIYRETLILTFIGILAGFGLGTFLSRLVLDMVEVDFMLFPPTILWTSYLYAALLSLSFSIVVMLIMHQKLKHVDMIEALKSVE